VKKLDRSLSLSSVSSLSSVTKLKRSPSFNGSDLTRIKFGLNSNLQIEHASNLSWNFQVVLAVVGDTRNEFGRHKIAFFSEQETKNFVRLAINKGATQKISNVETPTTSPTTTLRKSRSFDIRRPLRPISENLQYFEEAFIEEDFNEEEEQQVNATMPTQINNSSKILRRKSTGSSDTSKSSTNFLKKKSPLSSTVSVSSVELKFQRKNSMTGRIKKGCVAPSPNNNNNNSELWFENNRSNLRENSAKNDNDDDDEYYDDDKLSAYNDRLKAKKKSHNSLESEEMTSDDGCVTSPDDSDVSESDEEASQNSLASPEATKIW